MKTQESEKKRKIRDIRRQYGLTSRAVADTANVELQTEYLLEIGGMVNSREIEKVLEALSHLTGERFTSENVGGLCIPINRISKDLTQFNVMH